MKASTYEERKAVIKHLRRWREQYPEDIWPKPFPGCVPDLYAIQMARHVLDRLIEDIDTGKHRVKP